MNRSKIVAAAALSLLAAIGAHAESYEGVHPLTTGRSRAEVRAEAVVAAHSESPYSDLAQSRVTALPSSPADRGGVRREAVATSHGPDRYSDAYGQGVAAVVPGFIDRDKSRADARLAARSPQDPY